MKAPGLRINELTLNAVNVELTKIAVALNAVADTAGASLSTTDLKSINAALAQVQAALNNKVDKTTGVMPHATNHALGGSDELLLSESQITGLVTDLAAITANIAAHLANVANPHATTYSQTGAEPANANIQAHIASTSNPHSTTAAQVGLGNCDNTSDANKPVSTAQQTALNGAKAYAYMFGG